MKSIIHEVSTPEEPVNDNAEFDKWYNYARERGHSNPIGYAILKVGE